MSIYTLLVVGGGAPGLTTVYKLNSSPGVLHFNLWAHKDNISWMHSKSRSVSIPVTCDDMRTTCGCFLKISAGECTCSWHELEHSL